MHTPAHENSTTGLLVGAMAVARPHRRKPRASLRAPGGPRRHQRHPSTTAAAPGARPAGPAPAPVRRRPRDLLRRGKRVAGWDQPPADVTGLIIGPVYAAPEVVTKTRTGRSTTTMKSTDSKIYPASRMPATFLHAPTRRIRQPHRDHQPSGALHAARGPSTASWASSWQRRFIIGAEDRTRCSRCSTIIAEKKCRRWWPFHQQRQRRRAGSERGLEYDTMFAAIRFQIVARCGRQKLTKLTKNPGLVRRWRRSGGSAALIMAWYHPSASPRADDPLTAVNQQWRIAPEPWRRLGPMRHHSQ